MQRPGRALGAGFPDAPWALLGRYETTQPGGHSNSGDVRVKAMRWQRKAPPMLAKIRRPAKTAMQSGKAGTKAWVLEFEPGAALRPDVLMGWTSSADPSGQVQLRFESKEAAIAFARAHDIPHQVFEPDEVKPIPKAYGDNFAYRRREPWSH